MYYPQDGRKRTMVTAAGAKLPILQRVGSIRNHSCYFRTTVKPPHRKALLQITERCNLNCAHCFVSAGDYGDSMPFTAIRDRLIPQLVAAQVVRVTLTGGEPTIHPDFLAIVDACTDAGFEVTVCTNGLNHDEQTIRRLQRSGKVHINVSLDGFRRESHGKFRGRPESFDQTKAGIEAFSRAGLLKGLLVTPNDLASESEYIELHDFAAASNVQYVLMNPLSPFGRGAKAQRLTSGDDAMLRIRDATEPYANRMDLVRIRFPNDSQPLEGCEAGNIFYVFTNGDVAVCPYLVFAADSPQSKHKRSEFMAGNVFSDDLAKALDEYPYKKRLAMGQNATCTGCAVESKCGKGCPAAVVAQGERIGALDSQVCPVA